MPNHSWDTYIPIPYIYIPTSVSVLYFVFHKELKF